MQDEWNIPRINRRVRVQMRSGRTLGLGFAPKLSSLFPCGTRWKRWLAVRAGLLI
jgi:hypothetical protein